MLHGPGACLTFFQKEPLVSGLEVRAGFPALDFCTVINARESYSCSSNSCSSTSTNTDGVAGYRATASRWTTGSENAGIGITHKITSENLVHFITIQV